MDIECTQANLAQALTSVSRLAGTRGTLPVLGNILLSIEHGRLKVAATDLEVGIQTWVGGKVEREGALTVPARLILDFVLANSDDTIRLAAKETTLTLTSQRYTANIKGIAASEFPLIPEPKRGTPLRLAAAALKEAIQQTVFATAVDETRPVLSGILWRVEGASVRLAATDSYRLAEKVLPAEGKHAPLSVIVPARTFQELARLLTVGEGSVEIYVAENQILFSFGATTFISRLIDGVFPDYEQIIPAKQTTELVVEKAALSQVMKMASFFARESANNVRLNVGVKDVVVTAVSPQLGDATAKLSAVTSGEPVEIAFNAKFILDALAVFPGETLRFGLAGKLSPGVLRPEKAKDYLYLVMPLRADV